MTYMVFCKVMSNEYYLYRVQYEVSVRTFCTAQNSQFVKVYLLYRTLTPP